ncbi:MAG: VWA domain-containing protein [Sulfurovum sp.]|nr:VWA domain-containing protein [Sulfurovum sp.]MCB4780228.1 VWA domain-containing protein [Sulfurovum sp.]
MTLLYPQFLFLLIPLGLLSYLLRPRLLQQYIHLIILGLIIFSLSRPQLEKGVKEIPIQAQDILIALDVSYSMRVQDIKPNRYTYAKETINALLEANTKDNIMLIAFTTNPLLLSPPTTDHQLIHMALSALEPKNILTKGTSLENLFKKITSFKQKYREVLLITDGGEEHNLHKLLGALNGTNIHLTILALGTTQGATIPKDDGTMLKDKQNHLVISRINPLLISLANATGGTYLIASGTPQQSANAITKSFLQGNRHNRLINKLYQNHTELYFLPLLLAAILFIVLHTRASYYLLLFVTLAGVNLQASLFDSLALNNAYNAYMQKDYNRSKKTLLDIKTPSLQQRYALATTIYRLGDYTTARKLYASIQTTSPKLKQKLYYNIANTYVMEHTYDKAKMYYTKALQLGKEEDATYNLALISWLKNYHNHQISITQPKPQGSQKNKNKAQYNKSNKSTNNSQQQISSGSSTGGQREDKSKRKEQQKEKLKFDRERQPLPLGSKVYELINKGYIREIQPW